MFIRNLRLFDLYSVRLLFLLSFLLHGGNPICIGIAILTDGGGHAAFLRLYLRLGRLRLTVLAFGFSHCPRRRIIERVEQSLPERSKCRTQKLRHLYNSRRLHEKADEADSKSLVIQIEKLGDWNRLSEKLADEAIGVVDKEVIERRTKYTVLYGPRHSVGNVSFETLKDKASHVTQERCVKDRTKYRGRIVGRRSLAEGLVGKIAKLAKPQRSEQLGKHNRHQSKRESVHELVTDIERSIVDEDKRRDAARHE